MSEKNFIDFLIDLMDTDTELTMETRLADIEEWDSLSYVAFLASMSKMVDRRIEPKEVKLAETVKDLYGLTR